MGEDPEKFYWFKTNKQLFESTAEAFCKNPITDEQKESIRSKTIELFKLKDGKKIYSDMLKDFGITTARHLTSSLAEIFVLELNGKIGTN